jgi:prepilin-type N-terminal cleavage/methylation domain-containing protein
MRIVGMKKGFTLIELLVVLAIMAILMALLVPVGKSMIVSNQVMTCAGNMHKVQQALKMYYTDYQGVPPVWIKASAGSETLPTAEMESLTATPVDPGSGQPANPLMALYTQQYLRDKTVLHCPADLANMDQNLPGYYESYSWMQPSTTPASQLVKIEYMNQDGGDTYNGKDIETNRFKYMPCRLFNWVLPAAGANPPPTAGTLQQEMSPGMTAVTVGGQKYWVSTVDSTWMPADSTVITWCDSHAVNYTKNGVGQYQVLFWDGSVQMMARTWLEQGSATAGPPAAAWEVTPGDQ